MASLYFRRSAWELRYREPSGKQRCERVRGRHAAPRTGGGPLPAG
jgi:hypothetical protein